MENHSNKVVVIGSFQKHALEISQIAGAMEAQGVEVLSPTRANPTGPFLASARDAPTQSPYDLQFAVLTKIFRASLVYLVNPGGYVGYSTACEAGYVALTDTNILLHQNPMRFDADVPHSLRDLFIGLPSATQIWSNAFPNQLALAKDFRWKLDENQRKEVRLAVKAWLDSFSKEPVESRK